MSCKGQTRFLYLDLLRGIAIIAVLFQHMPITHITAPIDFILRMGWAGVDLFLVLSGFLISGLLFKDLDQYGQPRIKRFLIRRGFKIYPPYYLVILAIFTYNSIKELPTDFFFPCLIFIQNYNFDIWVTGSYLEHTWSLALEEHFYFLLPPLILIFRKHIIWVCVFVCVSCLILRFITFHELGYVVSTKIIYPSHLRADSLMAGVLLQYIQHYHRNALDAFLKQQSGTMTLIAMMSMGLFLLLHYHGHTFTLGVTFLYISFALILILLSKKSFPSFWGFDLIANIGKGSYLIYLVHIPVKAFLLPKVGMALNGNVLGFLLAYFIFSFLIGLLLYRFLEIPMLRLRDRLIP